MRSRPTDIKSAPRPLLHPLPQDTADVVYTEDELKLLQVLCDAAARAVQSAA